MPDSFTLSNAKQFYLSMGERCQSIVNSELSVGVGSQCMNSAWIRGNDVVQMLQMKRQEISW